MAMSSPSEKPDQFLVGGGVPECLKPGYVNRRKVPWRSRPDCCGVIIGAPKSEAAFFGLMGDKPVPGIPHAWIQAKGSDVTRYARYIQSLNLRNITPRMVLSAAFQIQRRCPNSLPPKTYWQKLGPTLKLIDSIVTPHWLSA